MVSARPVPQRRVIDKNKIAGGVAEAATFVKDDALAGTVLHLHRKQSLRQDSRGARIRARMMPVRKLASMMAACRLPAASRC